MRIEINQQDLDSFVKSIINEDSIKQSVGKACALVEREAKENCPSNTHELQRSITFEVQQNDNEIIGSVFTPVDYAPYVEYGTGLFAANGDGRKDVPWRYQDDKGEWHTTCGQAPQPFMRPAVDNNKQKILNIIAGGIAE